MIHQTKEKLTRMNLAGMVDALKEQSESPHYRELSFEERLAFLVDKEYLRRVNVAHSRRRKVARLRANALLEQVDFTLPRTLRKADFLRYAEGQWIRDRQNLIITGATGVGKTFLASVLADKACRDGLNCLLVKLGDLIPMLMLARADGSYEKLRKKFSRINLLVVDEWMRDAIPGHQARELLDLFDERYAVGSTLLVAQVPVAQWHTRIEDPTIADAILDRLIHNAHRLELSGDSVRKLKNNLG